MERNTAFSRKKWEEGLREDLALELNRLVGIPVDQLIDGPRSRLLEVVKIAMSKRLAEAIKKYDSVETLPDVELEIVIEPVAPPKEDSKETEEEKLKKSRKPPAERECKICHEVKPCNRLGYCYPCWLTDKLHKDSGGAWLPGDKHPSTCGCDGPGGCSTKFQGN